MKAMHTMAQKPLGWGKPFWLTIHYVALGYPDDPTPSERAAYKAFFHGIPGVLPCSKCRPHFSEVIARIPIEPYLSDSKALFTWTVLVHNEVNRSVGKPTWDVEHARATFLTGHMDGDAKKADASPTLRRFAILVGILVSALIVVGAVVLLRSRASPRPGRPTFSRTK